MTSVDLCDDLLGIMHHGDASFHLAPFVRAWLIYYHGLCILTDCMLLNAVYNVIPVISRRPVHLSMHSLALRIITIHLSSWLRK